jgi:hypothetical protein
MEAADTGYQLGSDSAELERLDLQGRVLAPATRTILRMAGLGRGMRIPDLGSGAADVSFVAAALAGARSVFAHPMLNSAGVPPARHAERWRRDFTRGANR